LDGGWEYQQEGLEIVSCCDASAFSAADAAASWANTRSVIQSNPVSNPQSNASTDASSYPFADFGSNASFISSNVSPARRDAFSDVCSINAFSDTTHSTTHRTIVDGRIWRLLCDR
jgi:hypothetical protein